MLLHSLLPVLCWVSLSDFVRSRQYIRRNRQADLLGSFEIDDQLELRRLLDRQVRGLRTFENLVDNGRYTLVSFRGIVPIRHEPTCLDIRPIVEHCR